MWYVASVFLLIACCHLFQGGGVIFQGADDWSSVIRAEVIPCSPLKPELIQEEKIDEVCNEAFDELLTHEFNPD
jgi:hypothetical protein